MASAKIEAFLALEGTAAAQMDRIWREKANSFIKRLTAFLEVDDFTGAYLFVQNLDMNGVVQEARPEIEATLISCLLFGAQHHVPDIKETYLMQRPKVPQELYNAVDQLVVLIEQDAAEYLRREADKFIRAEEEKALQTKMAFVKADTSELADALNAAVMGTGKAFINIGANVTTSRLVTYGFLAQAMEVGSTTYQVTEVLDGKTCPVCRVMHGKTFTVENELSRLKTILSMQDPSDIKQASPWPSQSKASVKNLRSMSEEDLQANGLGSPPYHPNCRGQLAVIGTVQPLAPAGLLGDGVPDHLVPTVGDEPIATVASVVEDTVAGIRAFLRRKPKGFKKPTPPALQKPINAAFRAEIGGLTTSEIRDAITSIEDAIDLQAAVNALDNRDADTLRMLLVKYGFIAG